MNHHSWTALKNNTFTPEQIEKMENYTMTQYDMFIETLKNKGIEFSVDLGVNDMENIINVPNTMLKSLKFHFDLKGKLLPY